MPSKDDGSLVLSLARAQLSVPLLPVRSSRRAAGTPVGSSATAVPAAAGAGVATADSSFSTTENLPQTTPPTAAAAAAAAVGENVAVKADERSADGDVDTPVRSPNGVDGAGGEDNKNNGVAEATALAERAAGSDDDSTPGGNAADKHDTGANDPEVDVPPTDLIVNGVEKPQEGDASVAMSIDTEAATAPPPPPEWGLTTDVIKILEETGRPTGRDQLQQLARAALRAGDADRLLLCLGRLEGEAPGGSAGGSGRADQFDDPLAVAERERRREEKAEGRAVGGGGRAGRTIGVRCVYVDILHNFLCLI